MDKEKINIIKILNNLRLYCLLKNKIHQAEQYKKTIYNIENDIPITFNENSTILLKIKEIIETGTLNNYDEILSDHKFKLYNEFKSIFGIGDINAIKMAKKLNNFDEIYNYKLNRIQQIGLKYKNELNKKVSKKIINKHLFNIKKIIKFDKEIKLEIVGSFRRHKNDLNYKFKDLDILIISNKKSLKEIFKPEYFFKIFCYGNKKIIALSKIKNSILKIDILLTSKKSFPFAYIYFTGPKLFNIFLRKEAKNQNLKLNEYGLSNFNCKNEKDIFKILNIKYMNLKERNEFE